MSAIKLLLLEDNDLDAQLILRELRELDQEFETKLVSEKNEYEQAVKYWSPDIIISDFKLQYFNGDEALAFAKKVNPEIPFITLSGSITKTMEVKLLENYANDVLTKNNLKRLPFAVNRVLNERVEKEKLNTTLLELEENLKFHGALSEISIRFNSTESLDSKINYAFEILGKVTNVSRVYLFEDFEDGKFTRNTFEWCADDVSPQIESLQRVSYDNDIPSWKPHLIKKGRIFCFDITELDEDMRDLLEYQEIKAVIVYPIYLKNKYIGFIGFDEVRNNRKWKNSEDKLLKSVSGIVSNILSEKKAKDQLRASNKRLSNLLKEKELLVGEVHHRVKNNLALISSFLQLEKFGISKSDSMEQLIEANIIRVRSIGIVHETVYKQGSFTKIDVLEVFKEIVHSTFSEKNMVSLVAIDKPEARVHFNINTAVPFSLLVSEVMFQVLNTLDANKLSLSNRIKVSVSEKNGAKSITIEEPKLAKVLLRLKKEDKFTEVIEVLAKQIGAELSILPGGKVFRITFADKSIRGPSNTIDV